MEGDEKTGSTITCDRKNEISYRTPLCQNSELSFRHADKNISSAEDRRQKPAVSMYYNITEGNTTEKKKKRHGDGSLSGEGEQRGRFFLTH